MKTNVIKCAIVMTLVACSNASLAQVLDLQTGRSADLAGERAVSLEGGVVIGDADFIGARVNIKVAEKMLLMGDVGLTDYGDDELSLGGAAMIQLTTTESTPVALKFGAHFAPDSDSNIVDLSALAILSGVINTSFDWYANGGVHYVDRDHDNEGQGQGDPDDDDIVPTLGCGVVYEISGTAEAFAAVDALLGDTHDDVVIGGGIRLAL